MSLSRFKFSLSLKVGGAYRLALKLCDGNREHAEIILKKLLEGEDSAKEIMTELKNHFGENDEICVVLGIICDFIYENTEEIMEEAKDFFPENTKRSVILLIKEAFEEIMMEMTLRK